MDKSKDVQSLFSTDIALKANVKFQKHFWGNEDEILETFLAQFKHSLGLINALDKFYAERAVIEKEYSSKLSQLVQSNLELPLEGPAHDNVEAMKTETQNMANGHSSLSAQIDAELRPALKGFLSDSQDKHESLAFAIEELYQEKTTLEIELIEKKDAYEYNCQKLCTYNEQRAKLSGRELDRHAIKLRKAAISVQKSEEEYKETVENLQIVYDEWTNKWKKACDIFQQLEEYRIEFMKTSMWGYANVISTACVTDDESCERIRLTLEKSDLNSELEAFVKSHSAGNSPPDRPVFHDFFEDNHINLNWKQLTSNTASSLSKLNSSRTASPTRSFFSNLKHTPSAGSSSLSREASQKTIESEKRTTPPVNAPSISVSNAQSNLDDSLSPKMEFRPVQAQTVPSVVLPGSEGHNDVAHSTPTMQTHEADISRNMHEDTQPKQVPPPVNVTSDAEMDVEREQPALVNNRQPTNQQRPTSVNHSVNQHERVPITNPTTSASSTNLSFSRHGSPQKRTTSLKKKSIMERMARPTSPFRGNSFSRLSMYNDMTKDPAEADNKTTEPDDIDPRDNVVLNVGPNMLSVGEATTASVPAQNNGIDPIANAMAELSVSLKNRPRRGSATVNVNSQMEPTSPSRNRRDSTFGHRHSQSMITASNRGFASVTSLSDVEGSPRRTTLGAPPAAHTSAQMQRMSSSFINQTKQVFGGDPSNAVGKRESLRYSTSGRNRATSPMLTHRSPSPLTDALNRTTSRGATTPEPRGGSLHQKYQRSASPALSFDENNRSPSRLYTQRAASPNPMGSRSPSRMRQRATSPNPSIRNMSRPGSVIDLNDSEVKRPSSRAEYNGSRYGRPSSRQQLGRSGSGLQKNSSTLRSKSPTPSAISRQSRTDSRPAFTADGEPILGYVIALYDYQAQIPEELSFQKGDTMLVLRTQADGWWEGEIVNAHHPKRGLFPSNFVQTI
ncbi:cell division control protein Cdc15 [Schizosaccharomyces japonicus yFS275]|uniref:Cell division control protein Cdc15 n=1 Tax=Schizosaccharomyces japonicus (strain yFS275 / FY16936) TaxID=402676 RepID=B6K4N4_SCHJY|nr:cell division control protein Cdc15 [Schizosaccharomyces japonicus yFS275]EEB08441.2 cell division control protein Cdc15 [Schizosaccharomyces japonicus yFS275]